MILEEESEAGLHVLYTVGLVTAIITAFYLTRAYCLTFFSTPKQEESERQYIKEAPPVMLAPVTVLGILSVVGGFLGFCFCHTPVLATFLSEVDISIPTDEFNIGFLLAPETLMSIVVITGIGVAAYVYTHYSDKPIPLLKAFTSMNFTGMSLAYP